MPLASSVEGFSSDGGKMNEVAQQESEIGQTSEINTVERSASRKRMLVIATSWI
jgi:hypothetical protein